MAELFMREIGYFDEKIALVLEYWPLQITFVGK